MDKLFKAINLSGGYRNNAVIKNINFEINYGDFIGIIGPNGSGKTTLLRLMSKVINPLSGRIEFSGSDLRSIKLKEFCQRTAFVQQDAVVNFPFDVMEFVMMGRIPHLGRLQQEGKKDFEIAEKALFMTDTLDLKEKQIDELSAGERQRVTIAKALAQEPLLIFLDEPTSHLDIGHQIQIMDLLKKLNKNNNLTIVIVLHDLNLSGLYCDRIILLEKGRVFKEGVPEEVLTYQNIEAVYKTLVVVQQDPVNSKPHVTLVPEVK